MMKKMLFTCLLPLCLAMSACVEDAELMEEPDLMTVTTAAVSSGQVTLTSTIGEQPYGKNASERGFVVIRSTPDGVSERETLQVEGGDFSLTLTDDLWSSISCEAYAYVVTEGRRYRSQKVAFRPQGGDPAKVTGVRVAPDTRTSVTGKVTVYGQHLSKFQFGTTISLSKKLEGEVTFKPVVCTLDSVVFSYVCCNIGTWDMTFQVHGQRFPLDRQLVVDDATLSLDPVIYAGRPHHIGINRRGSSNITDVQCILSGTTPLTTRRDLMGDNEWYAAFTGKIGQEHEVSVHYTENGHDIYFQPVHLTYTNAWERIDCPSPTYMPQSVIGGYGWSLQGGWNNQYEPLLLYRLDFRTGKEQIYEAPCRRGQDGVQHLLGYARDYNVFGEADGQKVYCAAYIGLDGESVDDPDSWAFGLQRIRLYEFDIQSETWTWLYDLPTQGSQENNGYQIWSKKGERFYFINYVKGEFGWWDRETGELVKQSQSNLWAYYNNHIGSDDRGFFFMTNDLSFVSFDDASQMQMVWQDLVFEKFRTGSGYDDYMYGGTYRVLDGHLCNSDLMCSSPTNDLTRRTFYGSPDGLHGYFLYPVGNEVFCMDFNDHQLWRSKL